MPLAKWDLRVHLLAEKEILFLKEHHPEILKTLLTEFKLLAQLEDPRRHPNVKPMFDVVEGWYRLALYQHNYRVVFRLLSRRVRDEKWLEVWEKDSVEAMGEFIIEITRAGYRHVAYDPRTLKNRKLGVDSGEKFSP